MSLDLLPGIDSTAAALAAERVRMEVVSQNISNAYTTRAADGQPYQRHQVSFEHVLRNQSSEPGSAAGSTYLTVARVERDQRPPKMVHNPNHPEANKDGMVSMPDINIHEEMVDLIASSRAFEANLAVVKNARQIAMQTLSIGKR